MMHGFGIKYYSNGNIHEGKWQNDKAHGAGKLFKASDNTTKEANWHSGKLQNWNYNGKSKSKLS